MTKPPPQNLDAEMALLGACMAGRDFAAAAIPHVRPEDFYAHVHAPIFAAIVRAFDAGRPHDKITIAEDLRARNELESIGGISYLSSLLDAALECALDDVASVTYYAQIIAEKAVLYRLMRAGERICEIGLHGEEDVSAAIADAEQELERAVRAFSRPSKGGLLADVMQQTWREIDAAVGGNVRAQNTPWPTLDEMTGGFFPGEMVMWFGRPKDGKTRAVTQLAYHVARAYGVVVFFSLEMGEIGIARRMVAGHAQISTRRLRLGRLGPHDFDRIGEAMQTLSNLPMYVYGGIWSISEMRRTLIGIHAKTPVCAVIVDHIGFVDDVVNGERNVTENERLDRAYKRLLGVTKEIGCVMHVVAHANRAGYDQEPTLKNIRGGGNAEGHAHAIIAPYRPDPEHHPTDGKFLVIATREGENGAIPMQFDGARDGWTEAGSQMEVA